MPLSEAELKQTARRWIYKEFVRANVTATMHWDDVKAAAQVLDTAFNTPVKDLPQPTKSWVVNAAGLLPEPFKTETTTAQKAILAAIVLLRIGGVDLEIR